VFTANDLFSYILDALNSTIPRCLSQDVIYNLRLELTQSILACPLSQIETLGTPKLLAALTEDVNTIAGSSIAISGMGANISLIIYFQVPISINYIVKLLHLILPRLSYSTNLNFIKMLC
jgi:ABC-type siderophore export system fused ATPase/permease subunit